MRSAIAIAIAVIASAIPNLRYVSMTTPSIVPRSPPLSASPPGAARSAPALPFAVDPQGQVFVPLATQGADEYRLTPWTEDDLEDAVSVRRVQPIHLVSAAAIGYHLVVVSLVAGRMTRS